ncbi:MAG: hypothetical protein IPK82_18215 [Polyangiaceae bacterium]|nr:hypothetical protein [Polyangiaceae bacterium]
MTTRIEARKKGLRMAAHLAVVTGVLAGAAAAAQGAPATPTTAQTESASGESASSENGVSALSALLRTNARGGNCGCAPCWGPPAPPAMSDPLPIFGEEYV